MKTFSKLFGKEKVSKEISSVVILKPVEFNLNELFNDISNAVTMKYKNNGLKLLFETGKDVPSKVIADRKQLGQLLITLLQHDVILQKNSTITFTVERIKEQSKEYYLSFNIITEHKIVDKHSELNALLKDKNSKVDTKFQKFIAVLSKMNGKFNSTEKSIGVEVQLSVKNPKEKRQYRLPSKAAIGLKVMIIDEETSASKVLAPKLQYFQHDVVIGSTYYNHLDFTSLLQYDLLFISEKIFNPEMIAPISHASTHGKLKFVLVESMFYKTENDKEALSMADSLIFKPVNQKTIYDLLINLYGEHSDEEDVAEDEEREQVILAPSTEKTITENKTTKEKESLSTSFNKLYTKLNQPIHFGKSESDNKKKKSDDEQSNFFSSLDNLYTKLNQPIHFGKSENDTKAENEDKLFKEQKIKKSNHIFLANEGLERVENDKEKFLTLLNGFLKEYAGSVTTIKRFRSKENFQKASEYCFNFKEILFQIGTYRLSHLVFLMEEAFKEEDKSKIDGYIVLYPKEFSKTVSSVQDFIFYLKEESISE